VYTSKAAFFNAPSRIFFLMPQASQVDRNIEKGMRQRGEVYEL
jgi:hypothetical protein